MKTKIWLFVTLFVLAAAMQSCKKDALTPNDLKKNQAEVSESFNAVASELGIKFEERQLSAIIRKYGNAKNWKDAILKFRNIHLQRHEHKNAQKEQNSVAEMQTSSNSTTNRLTLITPDGRYEINVPEDVTILDAAEVAGIDIQCSDRAGVSSTCVSKLISGFVDASNCTFLDDEDIEAGWILPCATYLTGDATIQTAQEETFISAKAAGITYYFNLTANESTQATKCIDDGSGPETFENNSYYGAPMFTKFRSSQWLFHRGPGFSFYRDGIGFGYYAICKGKVGLVDRASDTWTWLSLALSSVARDGMPYPGIVVDCTVNDSQTTFTEENAVNFRNIYYAGISFNYTFTTSVIASSVPLSRSRIFNWQTPYMDAKQDYPH